MMESKARDVFSKARRGTFRSVEAMSKSVNVKSLVIADDTFLYPLMVRYRKLQRGHLWVSSRLLDLCTQVS